MSETITYVPIITRIQKSVKDNTEDDVPPYIDAVEFLIQLQKDLSELCTELEYRKTEAESKAKVAKEYSRHSIKAYEEGRALVYGEILDILRDGQQNESK